VTQASKFSLPTAVRLGRIPAVVAVGDRGGTRSLLRELSKISRRAARAVRSVIAEFLEIHAGTADPVPRFAIGQKTIRRTTELDRKTKFALEFPVQMLVRIFCTGRFSTGRALTKPRKLLKFGFESRFCQSH